MTEPAGDARTRIADFLAAHARSDTSDQLAIRSAHDGEGYTVGVLWAYDVRTVLAELDATRVELERMRAAAGRA